MLLKRQLADAPTLDLTFAVNQLLSDKIKRSLILLCKLLSLRSLSKNQEKDEETGKTISIVSLLYHALIGVSSNQGVNSL